MPKVLKFTVVPRLPESLKPLLTVANNLWWTWDHEAIDLFHRLDPELWASTHQNPRKMLGDISQIHLDELAKDDSFLAHLERVHTRLQAYMAHNPWRQRNENAPKDFLVAYFSAEFGLHESIRI